MNTGEAGGLSPLESTGLVPMEGRRVATSQSTPRKRRVGGAKRKTKAKRSLKGGFIRQVRNKLAKRKANPKKSRRSQVGGGRKGKKTTCRSKRR